MQLREGQRLSLAFLRLALFITACSLSDRTGLLRGAAISGTAHTPPWGADAQHAVCSDVALQRLGLKQRHVLAAAAAGQELCRGDTLTDDTDVLRRELTRRNDSLRELYVLLVGADMPGAAAVQRLSVAAVGGTTQGATCTSADAPFVAERLGVPPAGGSASMPEAHRQTHRQASVMYSSLAPRQIRWCFQVVVSTDVDMLQSSVETHLPDSVVVVRPASKYILSGDAARASLPPQARRKRHTLLTWLASLMPYQAPSLAINTKMVERTAELLDQLEQRTLHSPLLVVTGLEAYSGREGAAVKSRLKDSFHALLPEVLFLDEGGGDETRGHMRAMYEVLFMRKFLKQADTVRELGVHYRLLRDVAQAEEERASPGHPESRMRRLHERIAAYRSDLQDFENVQYIGSLSRIVEQGVAIAVTVVLCLFALKVLSAVFTPLQEAFLVVGALGDDTVVQRPFKSSLAEKRG